MLEFFILTFFVNLLIALLQWYLLDRSLEQRVQSAAQRITTFWGDTLREYEIKFS